MRCLQGSVVALYVLSTIATDVIGQEGQVGNDATQDARLQISTSTKTTDEHRQLWRLKGSWNVTMKDLEGRGAQGITEFRSKVLGPFVTEDLEVGGGNLGFRVHAVYGYDTFRKKFTGTWFTSFNNVPFQGISNPDPDGKQFEFRLEHPLLKMKPTVTYFYRITLLDDLHMKMQLLHVDENREETIDAEFLATRSKAEQIKAD